jgi:hypothetical protein
MVNMDQTYPTITFQRSAFASPVPILQVEPYAESDGDTDHLCHAAVIPGTLIRSSHALGWTWKEYHVLAIDEGIQLSIRKILPNGAHDGCSLHCPVDNGYSRQESYTIKEMHKGTYLICSEYYHYRCNK